MDTMEWMEDTDGNLFIAVRLDCAMIADGDCEINISNYFI